jgi:Site-specific recombinase XerD
MVQIKPSNNNGSIRIRFTYKSKKYNLNPQGDFSNPLDLAKANVLSTQIDLDIRSGNFDETLKKYQPKTQSSKSRKAPKLLLLWDKWVDSLDLGEETKAGKYLDCRRLILKAQTEPRIDDANWFIKVTDHLAPSTFNQLLSYFKSCLNWCIVENLAGSNPFLKVKSKKAIKREIKPFSLDEMKLILEGFEKLNPHYVPFVLFLFLTGCRTSEAVGLQWKRINLDRNEITIADVVIISKVSRERVRKDSTKTGQITVLSMSEPLRNLLNSMPKGDPDDLLFKNQWGKEINRSVFRRTWKNVLECQGVEYRKPYTSRHTLASHAIDKGMTLQEVAYLLGHTDTTMVSKIYGHIINRPKLPNIEF